MRAFASCIYFILSSLLLAPPVPVRGRDVWASPLAHRQAKTLPPFSTSLSQAERARQSESGEAGRRVATDGFTSGCTEELWDAVAHRQSLSVGGRGVRKSQRWSRAGKRDRVRRLLPPLRL